MSATVEVLSRSVARVAPLNRFFRLAYTLRPPWEIRRAQPEFTDLFMRGEIKGKVLDVGCGTGENAIYMALQHLETVGIDFAPRAILRAWDNVLHLESRLGHAIHIHFETMDVFNIPSLFRTFDTIIDSGFFHSLTPGERVRFADMLPTLLNPGGKYHVLCFRDKGLGKFFPFHVTQGELYKTFHDGLKIQAIRDAKFHTLFGKVDAYLVTVVRE